MRDPAGGEQRAQGIQVVLGPHRFRVELAQHHLLAETAVMVHRRAGRKHLPCHRLPALAETRSFPIDHGRVQPLDQRTVGLSQQPGRLAHIPATGIEQALQWQIDGFQPIGHRQIGVFRLGKDKADVEITVRRSEAPGAAAGFAGIQDAHAVVDFQAMQQGVDLSGHGGENSTVRGPCQEEYIPLRVRVPAIPNS